MSATYGVILDGPYKARPRRRRGVLQPAVRNALWACLVALGALMLGALTVG